MNRFILLMSFALVLPITGFSKEKSNSRKTSSTVVEAKKCRSKADAFAGTVEKTYKNPNGFEFVEAKKNENNEFVYKYSFDYAVPRDDDRGTMISEYMLISLTGADCSLRKLEFTPLN